MSGIKLCTGQQYPHSFDLSDLEAFEQFTEEHTRCMWYSDVAHESITDTTAIAIRHDVDHSIIHAHRFAQWEAERGINSTYFILPTAPYFLQEPTKQLTLEMQEMGHEIGVHNDAYTYAVKRLPSLMNEVDKAKLAATIVLRDWVYFFRAWGLNITGCADHGGGEPKNVDLWEEPHAKRPEDAGLLYEAYALHHRPNIAYLSDNRGRWNAPMERVEGRQTHVLIHPCHWRLP